jgi:hypothetical protein
MVGEVKNNVFYKKVSDGSRVTFSRWQFMLQCCTWVSEKRVLAVNHGEHRARTFVQSVLVAKSNGHE